MNTPAPPSPGARVALARLFAALRREGFRLRPDDYVEVQRVLETFRPQTPDDVRALVAPLLVTSAAEQEKFDRVFEAAFQKISLPTPPAPPPAPPQKSRWGWWVGAGAALLLFLYVAFLWPMPNVSSTAVAHRFAGPYEVGDTLRFEVDSAVRNAAGPQVHWTWEIPDGLSHANEPEVAVVARKPGEVEIKLAVTRHEGLLVPGAFVTTTSTVRFPICANLPLVQLDTLPSRGGWHRYAARVTSGQPVRAVVWEVNGTAVSRDFAARDRYAFDYAPPRQSYGGSYVLAVRAYPDTSESLCYGEATLSRFVPGKDEATFALGVRSAGPRIVPQTRVKAPFVATTWGLGVALALVLGLYGWRVWRDARQKPSPPPTPPDDGENPLARFTGDEPPLEIPFENREASLIVHDEEFHQVVRTLRQRNEEETTRLHVPHTLRATLREGGFPTLVFQPRLVEVEYLFLIDRSQVRSQQVALFEYLFRAFCRENVGIERFFFHQHFDRFTNETHPHGLTLRQLTDAYRSRTLVVWSNGHPLLHPVVAAVDPALREALAEFAHRAVLTPVPFADWGRKERALQEFFLLLPADLPGQVRLMQALAEGQTRQDAYLRAQALAPGPGLQDLRSIAKLRAYLADDDLLQWLGAVALYPRLRWEVVVEMGRAVLPPERLNFGNLLKLVRIPWMHEGALPDRTRLELLKLLTPENEVKARETLLRMLDHAERYFPGERLFGEEKYLLQTTNRFTLYAHDANRYASYAPALKEFQTLRGKRLLPDRTMVRYLENEDRAWRTAIGGGEPEIPPMSLHPDSAMTRLVREIGELEAEAARLRQEEEEAFQSGREELASRLNVSRKAVESQLAEAKRRFDHLRESGGEPAGTSLADYFAALPPAEPAALPPPAPKPRDPLRLPLLVTAIGLLGLLLGVWYFRTTPRARELDPAQEIPLTVLLDSNACVTARNTSTTDAPRWTVLLNDSLVSLTNLRGTRAFPVATLQNSGATGGGWGNETSGSRMQNWFSTAFRPVPDSLQLYVTLAVRDTGSVPGQSRFVALAGDTLRVGISCPQTETPYRPIEAAASTQPSTPARLRVDVFYSEENQTATQRLARKLAQGLRASGPYDVQVKLLRTAMNQRPGYRVSGNEIRAEADERTRALELKAQAEAILRAEKITFPLRGVTSNNRTPNYVSLFLVSPGAAGNAFICQPVDEDWLARFDGWEGPYSDRSYSTPILNFFHVRSGALELRIVQQATVNGRTSTVQATELGQAFRVCLQNGVYFIQTTTGSGVLFRNVTNRSCRMAVVPLDATALNGPQGQAYFDQLVREASFSTYSAPSQPAATANEAAQTATPNDYKSANNSNVEQNVTSDWQRLRENISLANWNVATENFNTLNELIKISNPRGRLRFIIHCNANDFSSYRDRITKVLPAASGRIAFENQPLDTKAQAYPAPYAEVFGSGIRPPAASKD